MAQTSKAQLIRRSFNGGELAPELHYRTDLEAYHSGCKSLKNLMVTPWGAATRRPPTEMLAKIDTATYGVPVKYVPFRFSLTEVFHLVFTDGSGSASPDGSTADLIVFDAEGAVQTLDGASTDILNTVYDPDDLLALHFVQVNDFIYMTCGGDYPVQTVNRFFDSAWGDNRWSFDKWVLKSGPYGNLNQKKSSKLSTILPLWDNSVTYNENDVVVKTGTTHVISNVSIVEIDPKLGSGLRVTTATAHGYNLNTSVYISGVSVDGDSVDGNYVPFKIVDNFNFDLPLLGSSASQVNGKTYKSGDQFGLYRSLQDNNLNKSLTNTSWWKFEEFFDEEIQINSTSGAFKPTDVGRFLKIRDEKFSSTSYQWTTNQISQIFTLYGNVRLTTEGGAWKGVLEFQISEDGGATYNVIGVIRSAAGPQNGSIEREVPIGSLVRIQLKEYSQQSDYTLNACAWKLETTLDNYQHFKITEFVTIDEVKAQCVTPILSTITDHRWALGEFSETTGYPNTLVIHDERMVFGGTKNKPNTVWASRVNDWSNFLEGDTDVSPYTFTIKSDSFDTIRWMRSARNLMIGTENSESTMGTRDSSEAISPTNIDVATQTYFGSANIQAIVTADLVFFVQGQARRVRSSQYDFGTDQYLSSEMSIAAHHITEPGIKEMSFRRHPFSNLFFVLNDGTAVAFTYEREQAVKGWSRIELGGSGELLTAAANYSDSGDIVAGVVKRGSAYYLEQFGSTDDSTVFLDGQFQSDSGFNGGVATDFADTTGLVVVMDDSVLVEGTDYSWDGSTLTIPGHAGETVTVGYPFEFEIEPTDVVEFGEAGPDKRATRLSLFLKDSGGCTLHVNGKESQFADGAALAAGERLSGEYQVSVSGGYRSMIAVKLSGSGHRPFTLLGLGYRVGNA